MKNNHMSYSGLTRISIFLILLLTSCATTKTPRAVQNSLRPVYITNTKKIALLSPENTATTFDGVQYFTGTFGNQSFSLLSYTEINENGIVLALMNDFGTDMGNLFYDGTEAVLDSAFFPEKLPPEYIIAEIQNAYYDGEALKNLYEAARLRFEESAGEGSNLKIRRIYDGKKLVEEIAFSSGNVKITNFLRGYSFELVDAQ